MYFVTLVNDYFWTEYAPIDCVWDAWGGWTACSKTCGGGIQTKTRKKTKQEENGGRCSNRFTENKACGENECPGIFYIWCRILLLIKFMEYSLYDHLYISCFSDEGDNLCRSSKGGM